MDHLTCSVVRIEQEASEASYLVLDAIACRGCFTPLESAQLWHRPACATSGVCPDTLGIAERATLRIAEKALAAAHGGISQCLPR
jgi:hypothetical protein